MIYCRVKFCVRVLPVLAPGAPQFVSRHCAGPFGLNFPPQKVNQV